VPKDIYDRIMDKNKISFARTVFVQDKTSLLEDLKEKVAQSPFEKPRPEKRNPFSKPLQKSSSSSSRKRDGESGEALSVLRQPWRDQGKGYLTRMQPYLLKPVVTDKLSLAVTIVRPLL